MKGSVLTVLCAITFAQGRELFLQNRRLCTCNPNDRYEICANINLENIVVAHERCDKFYKCANSVPIPYCCAPNLVFNIDKGVCDWPGNVDCGNRTHVAEEDNECLKNNSNEDNDSEGNTGPCNCDPSEAPEICRAPGSEGVFVAHEYCNHYYVCNHGRPVAMKCAPRLLYNPYKKECDWESAVECGDRIIPEVNDIDNGNGNGTDNDGGDNQGTCNCDPSEAPVICAAQNSDGILVAHENCNQFYICNQGQPTTMSCSPNLLYNPYTEQCDWPSNVNCGDRFDPNCICKENEACDGNNGDSDNDTGGGDSGSGENSGDSGDSGTEGTSGDGGSGGGNSHSGSGGSGSGGGESDGGSTCNCNPSEAPNICAQYDSDGILVAHEKCNKFYICAHGRPVAMTCAPNLLYNPHTEKCDWPENVDCGDRVIPDDSDGNGDNDNGSGGAGGDGGSGGAGGDSGSGGSGGDGGSGGGNGDSGSGGGGSGNGESDGGSTCNCNPSEAPNICAQYDSDGILVAHEKCNKFYICAHGRPVAMTCAPNLLYNPHTEKCDWPENVDCGDRVIPDDSDGDGDNDNGSGGAGGDGGSGGAGGGGGSGGSGGDGGSGGGNGDSGSGGGGSGNGECDGGSTCNCNPSEAPNICAQYDSDGILVAHEKCNKFYICAHGRPVAMTCAPNLLYNPHTEKCDWPENVDCGDRVIPDDSDGDGDNDNGSGGAGGDGGSGGAGGDGGSGGSGGDSGSGGGNGDSGSGGGGSGNGESDGGSTCNCNPSEAPNICAQYDSDGILVAHEKCNKFYICAHGRPVAMTCAPNLLYNPHTEKCDWPENVDCGDRVIPDDSDGDGDNDNGSGGAGGDGGSGGAGGDGGSGGSGGDGGSGGGNGDSGSGGGGSGNGECDGGSTCNCNPSEAPNICAQYDSDGILVAHEKCNKFYICAHGRPVAMTCAPNLLYNPHTEKCDWPENVDCGDRVIPDDSDGDGDNDNGSGGAGGDGGSGGAGGDGGSGGGNGDSGSGGGGSGGGESDGGSTCNCNPSEAPNICAQYDSDGILVAHEKCNKFYICAHGRPVAMTCAPNLLYNPHTEKCDWPENVDCGDRVIPDDSDGDGDNDNGSGGAGGDGGSGGAGGDGGSGGSGGDGGSGGGNGDSGSGGGGSGNGESDGGSTCNCNPSEAPNICAQYDSDGILVAHEKCNKFYICAHGRPVAMTCAPNLLYNPHTEKCDWPENVDCGDRVIPDDSDGDGDNDNGSGGAGGDGGSGGAGGDGGSGGAGGDGGSGGGNGDSGSGGGSSGNGECDGGSTCNCNPSEAPNICAQHDSDGILVAHEKCNKFYICAHGRPVAMTCAPNLLYNPHTEKCDWPENVDCGDRVIPDDSDGDGDNDNGSGGAGGDGGSGGAGGDGGSGGGNGDSGSGGGGSGGGESDGGSTCNCNPSEAPNICAQYDSDGILVAHEKCNKFYICAHGRPVAMTCAPNLLYNPHTEKCDWPENVDCGDRVIPDDSDGDGDNDNGSGGAGGDGGSGGAGGDGGSGGGNGDSGSGGGGSGGGESDGGSTCNCNPSEAPNICAQHDSDGILVAHEKCNKFYICAHGRPVAMTCAPNLLYNPHTEKCDWPENVDCGDRVIPDDSDGVGDNDNGSGGAGGDGGSGGAGGDGGSGGGNGDSGSGGGGSGGGESDGGSTCNCNPSEAPNICAQYDSDGILVAHEKCNKFYICAHGRPVAMTCAPNLLYNPHTEKCDWPENVDCGDRVIPDDSDGDGDNDNGSGGAGGDGGSGGAGGDGGSGGSGGDGGSGGGNGDSGSGGGGSGNGECDGGSTCNCNPSEAPNICAQYDSDGILVAHEKCNKFYICAHGRPVAMTCAPNLLYNPHTEKCDWPENVDCGDRVIPDDSDGDGDNDNGSGGAGGDGGSGGAGGDGGSGGGGDSGGGSTCNCNPSDAANICAQYDSEGILVAHENCNQFYKCAHGLPVTMSCPRRLLYNPHTEKCDWPENVDCGDRVTPEDIDEDGDNVNSSEGAGNESGGNGGSSGDTGGESICNCNPSEAPTICAKDKSEGTLVAHENCTQFYKCANSRPVAMYCAPRLMYNPYIEQCDWPRNVDCGNRLIPDEVVNENVRANTDGKSDSEIGTGSEEKVGNSYFTSLNKHFEARYNFRI